eukprot:TRINITY_DN13234_c0_g1_i1.p1 TRINITY_DN13234_c0_g1~~TRINITY_DN13234_c0_g1_i1.p1  ORF type:complete len:585 (+),score=106.19 TRINITY_DN13234_c0_g1_i1:158-1912(+)
MAQSSTTTAINPEAWLRESLVDKDTKPSQILERYFSLCMREPKQSIVHRVEKLTEFLNSDTYQHSSNVSLRQVRSLGIKLYYKTLESMLVAEENRLQVSNFTTLLNNDDFHCSLVACSFEIVFTVFKLEKYMFPYLLDYFHIKSFELLKLIESFIRQEQTLPNSLIHHLSKIEERILEQVAWADLNSPIYTLLKEKDAPQTYQTLCQIWLSKQKTVPSSPWKMNQPLSRTPTKSTPSTPNHNSSSSSSFQTPTGPVTPSGESRGRYSYSLELFFRKVLHLLSVRVNDLSNRLQLPQPFINQILQTLINVVTHHSELMYNRHLDTLLMCSVYGVCLANKQKLTYRVIIDKYRIQPQSVAKIYREIPLDGEEKGDIIKFYNIKFIPRLENFIIQVTETATSQNNNTNNGNTSNNNNTLNIVNSVSVPHSSNSISTLETNNSSSSLALSSTSTISSSTSTRLAPPLSPSMTPISFYPSPVKSNTRPNALLGSFSPSTTISPTPIKPSAAHNLYLSPMKYPTNNTPMKLSSHYISGESLPNDLRNINQSLNRQTRKRLFPEVQEESQRKKPDVSSESPDETDSSPHTE